MDLQNSVNVVPTTGVVSNKTVYVRLTTAATGTPSGNIVLSSTGATDKTVALTGTVTNTPAAPNLTSTPICGSGAVIFTSATTRLNGSVSPNKLYNAETAGSVVDFTTPTISQTTDFWGTQTLNGCESPRAKVTAVVKQVSTASTSETACGSFLFGSKTLTTSGVYKDTIPNAVGCDSVRTLNLTINTTPTPTMPTLISNPICNSGTVTFTQVAPGRLSTIAPYRLYNAAVNGNVVGNVLTTPTILQNTDFWATVTLNGCESTRKKVTAIVNLLPIVSITVTPNDTINEGESLTLAGLGATTYSWNNGITDNGAFNPTQSDLYKVVGTDANGCSNVDSIKIVVNKLTAIESSSSTNFSIYPNPATVNVTITFTESVTGSVSIVDLHGNVVVTKSISTKNIISNRVKLFFN